jgi:hypothetical protein
MEMCSPHTNIYIIYTYTVPVWGFVIYRIYTYTAPVRDFFMQWNFFKPDPQKTGSPWISADFFSPCWTILCKRSLTKPVTPLNQPYLLVPVLAGLEKFQRLFTPMLYLWGALLYIYPYTVPVRSCVIYLPLYCTCVIYLHLYCTCEGLCYIFTPILYLWGALLYIYTYTVSEELCYIFTPLLYLWAALLISVDRKVLGG